jgi:drug/metabolite transporter (DMT)-like permease
MQLLGFNSPALGVAAGGLWGAGDFTGGLAARRANVFGVVVVGYSVGLLIMVALVALRHEPLPRSSSFIWASAAGLIGGIALAAFYAGLAEGKMGIVAPIAAVLTAAAPVLFAWIHEGLPRWFQVAGFGLALIALWLVSRPESSGPPEGLGLAILSGLGFGAYLILINEAGRDAIFWPLATSRAASVISLAAGSLVIRKFRLPARPVVKLCALAGALDAVGLACFLLAARSGRFDVAAVLSSLYPAVTVVLARLMLKEHMNLMQRWGMLAALAAVALIAA